MNPKRINHDLDREEYENASPTVGGQLLAHFSTPQGHRDDIYGADGLFFATYPAKRMYLRPAFRGEYDIPTTKEEEHNRPMLWVLVLQLEPGYHMILPTYRGRAFWSGIEADTNLPDVLLKMSLREGLDLSEWMGFIFDQRVRKGKLSKKHKRARVN